MSKLYNTTTIPSPAVLQRIDEIFDQRPLSVLSDALRDARAVMAETNPIIERMDAEIEARLDEMLPHITRGYQNVLNGRLIFHSGTPKDVAQARRTFSSWRKQPGVKIPNAVRAIREHAIRREWERRKMRRAPETAAVRDRHERHLEIAWEASTDIRFWVWETEAERAAKAAAIAIHKLQDDPDEDWDEGRFFLLRHRFLQLRALSDELGDNANEADDEIVNHAIIRTEDLLFVTPAPSQAQFIFKYMAIHYGRPDSPCREWKASLDADARRYLDDHAAESPAFSEKHA